MRTPLAVIAVLLAALVPVGFATDAGPSAGGAAVRRTAPLPTIARRVEALRALRFRTLPKPLHVSAATARREGLADFDRSYPPARRRADELLYTTLGLLPAGTDLRKVEGAVYSEQVAGYYDPRTGRLRIVDGAGADNAVENEITLAHELDHALEDQRFGLDTDRAEEGGDGGLAYTALVEGTATALMFEYLNRHFLPETALAGLLAGAFTGGDTSGLPPFVVSSLVFPYVSGRAFVADLYQRAGRRWTLIDLALSDRPPVSTEQILHPQAWIRVEVPDRVRLPGIGRALRRAGARRLAAGTFGEWQTQQLLLQAAGDAATAAAGWGGDRYEVWDGPHGPVVAIRWRWDSARDAAEFLPALRRAVSDLQAARVAAKGLETTLVVGPGFAR